MENTTNKIDINSSTPSPEQVVWPTKKPGIKKKYLVAAIFATALVLTAAVGSFYFVRNLNLASTPNAPSSEPQAAYTSKATKSWAEGGKDCPQGCGANEYCDNGRCRKSGGASDPRSPLQQQLGYGTQLVVSPTKPPLSDYVCTSENCPGPEFYCASANRCESSAGFCNGRRCSGSCVKDAANQYRCDTTTVPGVATGTSVGDPTSCSGVVCVSGVQYCDTTSGTGVCKAIPGTGAGLCDGIVADVTGRQSCCVPPGVGVDPDDASKIDNSIHWTNCAAGTTCVQGKGCFGPGAKTPEKTFTDITTVTTVTTTVTTTPSITVTVTPTATPSATITVTVTATPSATTTVQPTIAVCNESCEVDDDCSSGLYCDSESNKCRKSECSDETSCVCPTETPEPTIVDCNKRCNSDDNCSTGLKCDSESGRCRKPACSDEKDCSCPKPRKTDSPTREVTRTATRTVAQPTVLKEAGILDFPGAAVFGSGLLLTVIGILLAL